MDTACPVPAVKYLQMKYTRPIQYRIDSFDLI